MPYSITLTWTRRSDDFIYETYDRSHFIKFGGGTVLEVSSAPEFSGKGEHANPEEAFLASLSSCHMLTFLALAAKSRYTVDDYQDYAEAILEKNDQGQLAITTVTLRPLLVFSGEKQPDKDKILVLHEKAHRHCFIANSVKTEVRVLPQLG